MHIFDEQGQAVATGEVEEAGATDSLAEVRSGQEMKPGYIVSWRRD
ncbi:MAG: hypothetical protein AB1424_00270 [Thermodesulfobacteriota bacterium]